MVPGESLLLQSVGGRKGARSYTDRANKISLVHAKDVAVSD